MVGSGPFVVNTYGLQVILELKGIKLHPLIRDNHYRDPMMDNELVLKCLPYALISICPLMEIPLPTH